MGIYNRDYYHDSQQHQYFPSAYWQGWQIIMVATIFVLALQVLTYQRTPFGGYSEVTYWLSLRSNEFFQGQVWRIITYSFCHDIKDIWHILFNMLGLYFFGRDIEQRTGRIEFIAFYLTAAIIAGLAEILLAATTSYASNTVGASGSGMALVVLFAYWYPTATLIVMFIPVQAQTLALIFVGVDLYGVLAKLNLGVLDCIAHACHLGGAVFGFLYGYNRWRVTSYFDSGTWTSRIRRNPVKRMSQRPKHVKIYQPDLEKMDELDRQPEPENSDSQVVTLMDEILAKIFEHGEASLTPEERAIMQEASRRLQKKNQ